MASIGAICGVSVRASWPILCQEVAIKEISNLEARGLICPSNLNTAYPTLCTAEANRLSVAAANRYLAAANALDQARQQEAAAACGPGNVAACQEAGLPPPRSPGLAPTPGIPTPLGGSSGGGYNPATGSYYPGSPSSAP